MTKTDRTLLLKFITRTTMFIYPEDDKNVASFIHGYQLGTKNRCNFTLLLEKHLTSKYKIMKRSDGWPGQIARLSEKLSLRWIVIFKRTALEVLAAEQKGGFDGGDSLILKKRIASLIERIDTKESPWLDDHWREEWLSLCVIKQPWFKQVWADKEWAIIKSIDKQVNAGNISRNNS